MNFNICTVHCAECDSAVYHKLHVAGAARFRSGKGDLFTDIGGRHKVLCHCNIIILKIYDLETSSHVGVVIDKLAE